MIRLTLFLALFALPAAAQELQFTPQPTQTCLDAGQRYETCIGEAANACIEANGYATVVESGCYAAEADWWDARLNAAYRRVRASARENDRLGSPDAPAQAEALKQMQRAWIALRDATCAFEASQWGGGTGAGPAYAHCLMWQTAQQARYLEGLGMN